MGTKNYMSKILLLSQVLPYPADSGPKAKTLSVLKYLAANHDVTLASFVRDDPPEYVSALRQWCCAVHTVPMARSTSAEIMAMLRSVRTAQPWLMLRDERSSMQSLVDQLAAAQKFDVVYADQLNMAQYALRVSDGTHVLDLHNALWLLYERLAATMPYGLRRAVLEREWRLLREYEGAICGRFAHVLVVSEEDRRALRQAIGAELSALRVIPIALDADDVQPLVRDRTADRILHVGTMYWPPNIDGVQWFLREVLPVVRRMRPDAAFDCVGARPPASLLASVQDDPNVHITGYVEDVSPFLRSAGVMIVPLRAGGGMRVKILHALACGMPIVTTSLGCEGIALTHGRDALIADRPVDFAAAIETVLGDRILAARLGRNARALFEERYDYRVALRALDDVVDPSIGARVGAPAQQANA